MSNYILNVVEVTGEGASEKMKKYFTKKDLDFNKVIKMPKALQVEDSSDQKMQAIYEKNLKKYGYKSWYDFAKAKWGTKWNAYDQSNESFTKLIFYTAWKAPLPVLEEISKQNPELIINLKYAYENIGFDTGTVVFNGGKIIAKDIKQNNSKEAIEFAEELHNQYGYEK